MRGKLLENTPHMCSVQKPVPGGYPYWGAVELPGEGGRTGLVPLGALMSRDSHGNWYLWEFDGEQCGGREENLGLVPSQVLGGH